MRYLWKPLIMLWKVLLYTLPLSFIASFAYDFLRGQPVSLSRIPELVSTNWQWLLAVSLLLVCLSVWSWRDYKRYTQAMLAVQVGVWKRCSKLTPRDLFSQERAQAFHPFYLPRFVQCEKNGPESAEMVLRKYIDQRVDFLLIGKPGIGKTRTLWETLRDLKDYWLLKPNLSLVRQPDLSFLKGKDVVLLLDDLQGYYGESDLDLEGFRKRCGSLAHSLCIVCACREGPELGAVEASLVAGQRQFYEGLRKIRMVRLTGEDKEKLAKGIGLPEPASFDGTPAHVVLGQVLEDVKLRYAQHLSAEARTVLKALKLLYTAGIIPYYHERVRAVVAKIWELSIPLYQWQHILENLQNGGFLLSSPRQDPLEPEAAYLEAVLTDYVNVDSDLPYLGEALLKANDWAGLFYLAVRYQKLGQSQEAQQYYQQTLMIKPNVPEAHYNSAILLSPTDKGKAEDHYREALRLRPIYPECHLNLGILMRQMGKSEEARRHYCEALRLKPDYPEAHYNFGILLWDTSSKKEAEQHYWEALRIKQDLPEAHYNLAIALWNTDRWDEAEEHFREALHIKPDYPEALNNLGLFLWATKASREAEEHLRAALRLKSNYPEAHNNLGIILWAMKGSQQADEHFREALRLKPDYPEAHNNLGNLLRKQKEQTEAEEHYREALRLKPDYAEAYNDLGMLLLTTDRVLEAEICFREALRFKPDYREPRYNLTRASHIIAKKHELEHYRETICLRPDDVEAHCNLGKLLRQNGKKQEAEEHLREALSLKPGYFEAAYELWVLLKKSRRQQEAEKFLLELQAHYEDTFRLKPNNAQPYVELGILLRRVGKMQEAERYLREALRLQSDHPKANHDLAMLLRQAGKVQEAEEHFREALRLSPTYPEAHYDLAILLRQAGKAQEAEEHFREALRLQPNYPEARGKLRKLLKQMAKRRE